MQDKPNLQVPRIILNWLLDHKAWLVGSAVDWYVGKIKEVPRDLDILIPPDQWQSVVRTIPKGTPVELNRFGGFKLRIEDIVVDIWPQHLEDYFEVSASYTRPVQALRVNPYRVILDITGTAKTA